MKNTRRFISAVMALAMVSALAPMGAFASEGAPTTFKLDSTTKSGTMTATYDVSAKYTVTIPAGVALDSENSVTANLEASDVMLESGQKITVKLTGASNTESGATFHAKTTKGDSTATYTIGKGTATTGVKVGDVVAEFTGNNTQTLTFSKAEGATYAGTHTEQLTFGIAVENAVTTRTVTFNTATDGNTINKDGVTCSDSFDQYVNLFCWGSGFSVSSGQFTKIEVTASNTSMIGMDQMTMNTIEGWATTSQTTATWTGKSSTVPFGVIMGDEEPVTIVFTIEE